MVRMAGLEVRYKKDINDSKVPSKIAISSRMVTVASRVASATPNSVRLSLKRCRQRARSSKATATSMSKAASAAMGICASKGALTATSASSSNAEKTAASGVRAPACKLGMERFMEPHDT